MSIWYNITLIGEPALWMIFSGIILVTYFAVRGKVTEDARKMLTKCFFVLGVSIWLTLGIVFGLKTTLDIERPCTPCGTGVEDCNQYCLTDNSFPSGHSALIFAVFTSVHLCIRRKWFMPLFVVPFIVAVSRYFLNVHYMPDIIFGTMIGAFVPIFVLVFYEKKF
jgi:membrane-associated phospholipid phosphatase